MSMRAGRQVVVSSACTVVPWSVGTGPQGQIEPGVIIEHRQRMAALVIQGKVPFEVHLPQAIGVRMLETLIVSRLSRRVAGSSKP